MRIHMYIRMCMCKYSICIMCVLHMYLLMYMSCCTYVHTYVCIHMCTVTTNTMLYINMYMSCHVTMHCPQEEVGVLNGKINRMTSKKMGLQKRVDTLDQNVASLEDGLKKQKELFQVAN